MEATRHDKNTSFDMQSSYSMQNPNFKREKRRKGGIPMVKYPFAAVGSPPSLVYCWEFLPSSLQAMLQSSFKLSLTLSHSKFRLNYPKDGCHSLQVSPKCLQSVPPIAEV